MSNKEQGLIRRSIEALASLKDALRFPGSGGGQSSGGGYVTPVWNVLSDAWNGYGYSGTKIDYDREVGNPGGQSLVIAAVNWLGRVLPEAPLNVVEIDNEGMETPVPNHPAAKLWRKPNAFYSSTTLCKAYAYSWIVSGNPYILKVKNGGSRVTELWYVPPHMMRPLWPAGGSEFISGYEYKVEGATQIFEQEDVIHFRDGIDPMNIRLGLSPVASVMREIYTDQEIANYSALLMKNGAVPPVVISLKENVNAFQFDPNDVREKYLRQTQGDQRGKAWVSGAAVNVEKVGFSPNDLMLAQLRRLPEERLSAVIGIPAIVLGYGAGLDKATYSNARQLVEYATESYLVPLYRYIQEELTTQLLPDFEEDMTRFQFRFDLSGVRALSEDQDALYNRLTTAYRGGWLKRSEAREMAGYEWDAEDEIYAQVSTEGEQMVEDGENNTIMPKSPKRPLPEEPEKQKQEQKATDPDAVASDAVLDSAIPWLIALGEEEVAKMLQAEPILPITHE
jgi:HK97 family phage portal protein